MTIAHEMRQAAILANTVKRLQMRKRAFHAGDYGAATLKKGVKLPAAFFSWTARRSRFC
jgi:hypothetical protein